MVGHPKVKKAAVSRLYVSVNFTTHTRMLRRFSTLSPQTL